MDLEPSLLQQLEPILGPHCDTLFLQHSLERITYDSRTREVGVTLADGALVRSLIRSRSCFASVAVSDS